MNHSQVTTIPIQEYTLWEKIQKGRFLCSFSMELTARCINNCAHCFVNLPARDKDAKNSELPFSRIREIADEAASMGALWCLITGGEPLLREDFTEVYRYLKSKGLLVSVFTTASLITDHHIELFKKYPPRDIEVTVYGATRKTYESVTRTNGSYDAFIRGLDRLQQAGIKVRMKAMAIRNNYHEMEEIARFCRERTKDFFRFDAQLNLRHDGDPIRNEEIKQQRLSSSAILDLERRDTERFGALIKGCDRLIRSSGGLPEFDDRLFTCGAGTRSIDISYDGRLKLCDSLCHPDCTYDLIHGSLREAWEQFIPRIRDMRSKNEVYLKRCRVCNIINLCMWCPAHVHLETGCLDAPVEYFCELAHARAEMLTSAKKAI